MHGEGEIQCGEGISMGKSYKFNGCGMSNPSACPKPPARQTGVVNGEIIFLFLNGMHAFFTCFY